MFPITQMMAAARGWQEVSLAYTRLAWSTAQVMQARSLQIAAGTMHPAEAMRMVFEKPTAFAAGMEKAMIAAARSPDIAAATLAGLGPVNTRARAIARRLNRRRMK